MTRDDRNTQPPPKNATASLADPFSAIVRLIHRNSRNGHPIRYRVNLICEMADKGHRSRLSLL